MNRLKQLGKDSIIYGLGGMLASSISFLALPIYTRIFSPADYGSIEMLSLLSNFLGAFLVMGLDSAQSFYFYKYKDDGLVTQAHIVSSIFQWRLLFGTIFVLIATCISPVLNVVFFSGKLTLEYFAVAFASTLFTQILVQSAEVMRLLYRPWGYIGVTCLQSLVSTAFVLAFVLLLDLGVFGVFLGMLCGSFVVAIFGWYLARQYLDLTQLHNFWWPQLLRFGAPLVPAGLAIYVMSTSDRWFLQHYHGSEALGLFAIGAKFSLIMALVVGAFRQAWWPIAMDSINSSDGPQTLRMVARLYLGFGVSAVVILTSISPILIKLLTAPLYHQAWPIIAILSWQSLFYGFFLIASAGIWKSEKTHWNLYSMCIASVIGILLNFLFVPSYSVIGASMATVFSYMLWILLTMFISESLWRVSFSYHLHAFQIVIGGLYSVWYITTNPLSNLPLLVLVTFAVVIIQIMAVLGLTKIKAFIRGT